MRFQLSVIPGIYLLVLVSAGTAQVGTAVLVGRVTDPAGAVIVSAEVQARRISTNEIFRGASTQTGDYTIVNLPVDSYEVRVSSAGFKTEVLPNIPLEVGQTARINVQLTVGAVSDSVEVKAVSPILRTDTPEFQQVIDNTKIIGLPTNARDALGTLAGMTPGVAPSRSYLGGSGDYFNVRGQRIIDNVVLMDGAIISQGNAVTTFNVNPDALQEFQVMTGLYGAEYGIKPGGQFSLITKSGTNSPHGTVFELIRNNDLDARNFFDKTHSRPSYKRNQFGANLGAPIYLPKIFKGKDRAWFFFSYNGQRQIQFNPLTGVVPTDAQKSGQFSTSITDPLTGAPFPNNTIPSSRINPISQKLMTFWPSPNTPGQAFNFTSPNSGIRTPDDMVIVKIDFKISDTDHWSGRFIYDNSPQAQPNAIQTFYRQDLLRTWTQSVTNTRTFKQRIVNEFTFNFFRRPYYPGIQTSGTGLGKTLGIANYPASAADVDGLPLTSVTGLLSLADASRVGPSITGHWEARDTVSFNKGAHSFKAGYHFRRHYEFHGYVQRSTLTFQPRYTGNAFADFLLGDLTSAQEGADQLRDREFQIGQYMFFEDTWKINPKLTLTLGARYEYRSPYEDERGWHSNFILSTQSFDPPLQNLTLQPWQTGRYETYKPLISFNNKAVLPRIGGAYRLTSKTVIRTGFGSYENEPPLGMVSSLGNNPRPNDQVKNFISDPKSPNLFINAPFIPTTQSAASGVPDVYGFEKPLPQTLVYSWGFAIQRELTPNTALEVGYQGSHGVHDYVVSDVNDARPGPGALQSRRPYQQFQNINYVFASGTASYNGLEVKLERRPGPSGISMLLSYTWSKSMDNVGGRLYDAGDPTGLSNNVTLKNNRGEGEVNPMRFVYNLGYEAPFGHGKKYLTTGLLSQILGGWSAHTITTMQAGSYVTAVAPTDYLNVGSTVSSRPDVISNPNLPSDQRTVQRWFNTAAFVLPPIAQYRYGNEGRSIIQGPGIINVDFSLLRDFPVTEKSKLQFRFEAFNLTNHPNFLLPGLSFGTPTFGAIGSALDSRDLQFGLKLIF
jgi:hypothetical protein